MRIATGDFGMRILQGTATRDWHFVLLSCGHVEQATLKLKLTAEEGEPGRSNSQRLLWKSCDLGKSPDQMYKTPEERVTVLHKNLAVTLCLLQLLGCHLSNCSPLRLGHHRDNTRHGIK